MSIPKEIIENFIELAGEIEDLMNWNENIGETMKKVRKIYKKYPREEFVKLEYVNEEIEYALMFI